MILYNVTLSINADIEQDWLEWMKHVHLPEVMATQMFYEYGFYKIQNQNTEDDSLNYCVMYKAKSIQEYNSYINNYASSLRQKTIDIFGNQILAFRTVLEKVF